MEPECYPSSILPHTSRLFQDYAESVAQLAPFYTSTPTGRSWMREGRELTAEHRTHLADLLDAQNAEFGGAGVTAANIQRLRAGASAVVTGQQVTLFGGPLYTLLKAATAVARAREATEAGIDTVPVFWLASEDHDFAEVARVSLADPAALGGLRTLELSPQPEAAVPVGGIRLGERIGTLLDEAAGLLADGETMALLREAYRPEATMASAFGRLIARVFASWGLITIDAAGREFHALGAPVLEAAILDAEALHETLVARDEELTARGYHAQVAVTEHSGLLFLLDERTGARQPLRRVTSEAGPEWRAGAHRYQSSDLLEVLKLAPERISPNALLRPVFQDAILPTSAYIGGPAEVAYFAQSEVLYQSILGAATAILPRLSATLVEPKIAAAMERYDVQLPDAMTSAGTLAQRLGARAMPVEGKQKLAATGNALDTELTAVTEWMAALDAGLGRSAATAASKMRYQMNRLRRMAARFQLEKEASMARHARVITTALHPDGHLQERAVAGVSFLATQGLRLPERLVAAAANPCPGHRLIPL